MLFYYATNDEFGKFAGFVIGINREDCMNKAFEYGVKLFGVPIVHDKNNKKSTIKKTVLYGGTRK